MILGLLIFLRPLTFLDGHDFISSSTLVCTTTTSIVVADVNVVSLEKWGSIGVGTTIIIGNASNKNNNNNNENQFIVVRCSYQAIDSVKHFTRLHCMCQYEYRYPIIGKWLC